LYLATLDLLQMKFSLLGSHHLYLTLNHALEEDAVLNSLYKPVKH
jgi:hypothetical protein